jgi:hypothetical protein
LLLIVASTISWIKLNLKLKLIVFVDSVSDWSEKFCACFVDLYCFVDSKFTCGGG